MEPVRFVALDEKDKRESLVRGKKVRYKVIKRRTRKSALINGNSRFSLTYEKGRDVFAREDTLGVFVFTNRKSAEDWLWNFDIDHEEEELILVRVIPIGRGKTPNSIASGVRTENLEYFYKDEEEGYWTLFNTPPDQTLCYPGVHVLD